MTAEFKAGDTLHWVPHIINTAAEPMLWYRYEDVQWAPPFDENENAMGSGSLSVELRSFTVAKTTSKGVWLHQYGGSDRFVRREARKRFACPTQQEALESFIARKERQQSILTAQLNRATSALFIAKNRLGRTFVMSETVSLDPSFGVSTQESK